MVRVIPRIPERWRRRHPVVTGAGEGVCAGLALVLVWAMGLSMLAGVSWVLVLWVVMAATRPSSYQAMVALVLALVFDVMSGAPMGERMLPLAAALLAGSFAPGPVVRWDLSHGVFALYALGGYFAVELAEAVLVTSGDLFLARCAEGLLTLGVMSAGALGVAVWQHWTDGRSEGVGHDVPVLLRSLK